MFYCNEIPSTLSSSARRRQNNCMMDATYMPTININRYQIHRSWWQCLCVIGLTLFISGLSYAEIYTWTDENGNRIYSDQPNEKAETLELGPLPTYEPPKIPVKSAEETPAEPAFTQYDILVIQTPEQDETIHSNPGNITVIATVHPGLQPNHQLQLLLNGKPVLDPGKQTGWYLENVDRGEHQLQVIVITDKNETFQSSPIITVHLKRHSILLPKQIQPKPAP